MKSKNSKTIRVIIFSMCVILLLASCGKNSVKQVYLERILVHKIKEFGDKPDLLKQRDQKNRGINSEQDHKFLNYRRFDQL